MMTKLLNELDSLIMVLESNIPANPRRPENAKIEKALERDMADYFGKLEQALDMSAIEALYNKHIK